jgi:hypothetical protein
MGANEEELPARVSDEFAGAYFGDERLGRRLTLLAESLSRNPECSFPEAVETDTALEGPIDS